MRQAQRNLRKRSVVFTECLNINSWCLDKPKQATLCANPGKFRRAQTSRVYHRNHQHAISKSKPLKLAANPLVFTAPQMMILLAQICTRCYKNQRKQPGPYENFAVKTHRQLYARIQKHQTAPFLPSLIRSLTYEDFSCCPIRVPRPSSNYFLAPGSQVISRPNYFWEKLPEVHLPWRGRICTWTKRRPADRARGRARVRVRRYASPSWEPARKD